MKYGLSKWRDVGDGQVFARNACGQSFAAARLRVCEWTNEWVAEMRHEPRVGITITATGRGDTMRQAANNLRDKLVAEEMWHTAVHARQRFETLPGNEPCE